MAVAAVVAIVTMPMAVIFVFVKAPLIANLAFLIPMMVVVKAAARAVPIAGIETAAVVARRNPAGASVRRTAPITFVPAVVAGHGIPIAADPHEIRCGLRGHDNDGTRRGRRADLDPNGNLSFRGRACQQKRRNRGSFQ